MSVSKLMRMHQCTSCGGMYLCAPTQCDCMPDDQEYSDWAALPATDYAALEVERDTLRTANQRLDGEVARLTLAIANQTVRHFVGDDDQRQMDELVAAGIRADQQEIKRLREAVREFAGFFSSDDPKHWELHGLADGADYSAALTTNGEVTE